MRAHAEQAKQNQASGRAIQRATKNTPGKQKTEAKQIKQAKQAQVSKHTSKANQQGPRKNNARRTAWRHKGPPYAHEGINPSLGQFLRSSIFSPKPILQHFARVSALETGKVALIFSERVKLLSNISLERFRSSPGAQLQEITSSTFLIQLGQK